MLVTQNGTRQVLRQIVFKLTPDPALREDLTQEALVHLWLRELQRPGQSHSWYFQSCRFFLQNHLRNGRSVDSAKHYQTLCLAGSPDETVDSSSEDSAVNRSSVFALVSAREILSLLTKWLTPQERQILGCLADGLKVREIASRLSVSHTSVIRHRRRIASLALRLGVEPLPKRNGKNRMAVLT